MIARAIANEADVPFISCSASEFVELFVGMGAARVRKLFEQAREKAPCIVFIDEIDSIGKKRSGGGNFGGNDEREQTLNQILTEMDGFKSGAKNHVVVFGATNRIDTLDDALIRPGRFDRKIKVPLPNKNSREQILRSYINKVKTVGVDLDKLASRTRGMSGADLMNLVNEAAIMSVRRGSDKISGTHFDQAIEKISIGISKKSNQHSEGDSHRVAVHELGHALVGLLVEDFDEVDKISILSVGEAAGVTSFIPKESNESVATYKYYIQKIKVALGGHAAEDVIFGHYNVSSGATSDFQQVSSIAYHLIKDLGYSTMIGKLSLSEKNISNNTKMLIDQEVKQLVDTCYAEVKHVIKTNKSFIQYAAEELVNREIMTGSELNELYHAKK
jgi:cell division protease FtsH